MIEERNEISYTVLEISGSPSDLLTKVATAINVRLTIGNQNLPLLEAEKLENLVGLDKVFLYGPSGCGKSRTMFEIVRRNAESISRIFVINPRNNVGAPSGRMQLDELLSMLRENDAVIWDNFPDDLIKRDISNASRVLEMITSKNFRKLIVSLKPKYLEVFKNLPSTIPEFYTYYVSYDKDEIKRLLQLFGSIHSFKSVYEKYIVNNLERISKVLWQKEPTPLTVLDYYTELSQMGENLHIDAIREAEGLLRSTSYYEHQFMQLSSLQDRREEIDFLYALKISYELGIERDAINLAALQKAIFGTGPVEAPSEKLSMWTYLSGRQYAMHDVVREAVDFSDFVKIKIMNYIAHNFEKFVKGKDTNFVHTLGMFVGRNIAFLARDSPRQFLPEVIANYSSANDSFEQALGVGIGEAFESLEEDLQQVILDKADSALQLGAGMAEGFGHIFSSVDGERRKEMLQKTYSGLFFARYLGQSLGGVLNSLPIEIREDIFSYIDHNPQFADGIGIGAGHAYSDLEESMRGEIFRKARINLDLTRGLGFGFGLGLITLDDDQKKLVDEKSRNFAEFDKGIGMAVGTYYSNLPEKVKEEIIRRAASSSEFSLGLGIYLAITYRDKVPGEFMEKLENDSELAHGLGMGWGAYFGYLPKDFQNLLLTKALSNSRLELGIGSGLGFVFKHLPRESRAMFFGIADKRPLLDTGIGFGLGFTWMYQKNEMKEEVIDRIRIHGMFAYGLAYGHGYHFKYNDPKTQKEILDLASSSANFSIGLGYGLGYAFQNLGEELQNIFLKMIEKLPSFGYGLGSGIGRIMNYMSEEGQRAMLEIAETHGEFARGLGFGIGCYSTPYMPSQNVERFFGLSREYPKFCTGFAEGLGSSFEFLREGLAKRVMHVASSNFEFAFGLGNAFGRTFPYKSDALREEFSALSRLNGALSEGLGTGIGIIFTYLDQIVKRHAIDRCFTDPNFAKGLGRGLGSMLKSEDRLEDELLPLIRLEHFARGLGIGMGIRYPYLTEAEWSSLDRLTQDKIVMDGVGEGMGTILHHLTPEATSKIIKRAQSDKYFGKGMARGFAFSFFETNESLRSDVLGKIGESGVSAGLGSGFGVIFSRLDPQFQEKLFQSASYSDEFAKALGFSISHRYNNLTDWQSESIQRYVDMNKTFGLALGYGLGKHFAILVTEKQEMVISNIGKNAVFDTGLGYGLGSALGNLDPVVVRHLLKQARLENNFASAMGYGLGYAFPTMPPDLQRTILGEQEFGHEFADGFGKGLFKAAQYLKQDMYEMAAPLFRTGNPPSEIEELREETFAYDELPLSKGELSHAWRLQANEISFSGTREGLCVGFIDMIGSTKITSSLDENHLAKYYAVFLNSMATIAKNFGAEVVKNIGDALLFYFPKTSHEDDISSFRDVLECGLVMIDAHDMINASLMAENLPPLNYRISAEYGRVELATSQSTRSSDLFGSAVNAAAKINSKAAPNSLVIGEALYGKVAGLSDYVFGKLEGPVSGMATDYAVYNVKSKHKRISLNPFKRVSR